MVIQLYTFGEGRLLVTTWKCPSGSALLWNSGDRSEL